MAIQSRLLPTPVPVLLTRPEAQATRFAAQLTDRFGARVSSVVSPLLAPRYLLPTVPDLPWIGIILTSETGAQAAHGMPGLPKTAYCVGDRTAEAAASFGFHPISAQGDAEALIALILRKAKTGPLLHVHGAETRGDVAQRLSARGLQTESAIAYDQEERPLTAEAARLLHGHDPVLVPLFSPRTALLFAGAANQATAPLLIAALSPAVGQSCPPGAYIRIAARPDAGAMLDAIGQMLDEWAITRHPS